MKKKKKKKKNGCWGTVYDLILFWQPQGKNNMCLIGNLVISDFHCKQEKNVGGQ